MTTECHLASQHVNLRWCKGHSRICGDDDAERLTSECSLELFIDPELSVPNCNYLHKSLEMIQKKTPKTVAQHKRV